MGAETILHLATVLLKTCLSTAKESKTLVLAAFFAYFLPLLAKSMPPEAYNSITKPHPDRPQSDSAGVGHFYAARMGIRKIAARP